MPYAPFLVCQWSDRKNFFGLMIISQVEKTVENMTKYFLFEIIIGLMHAQLWQRRPDGEILLGRY